MEKFLTLCEGIPNLPSQINLPSQVTESIFQNKEILNLEKKEKETLVFKKLKAIETLNLYITNSIAINLKEELKTVIDFCLTNKKNLIIFLFDENENCV